MTRRQLRRLIPLTDFAWFIVGATTGFIGLGWILSIIFPGKAP